MAVVCLCLSLGTLLAMNVFVAVPGPFLLVPMLIFVLVAYSVGGLGSWTGRNRLDERERAADDHATAHAYNVIAATVTLITFYLGIVYFTKLGWPLPTTTGQMLDLAFPLMYLAITLPKAILAWNLPDPVGD